MDLSILIPFRPANERRLELFVWNVDRWKRFFPDAEIVVCDSDEDKPFNRSQARNICVERAANEVLMFCDGDTLSNKQTIVDSLTKVKDYPWYFPYVRYYNLTPGYSNQVLAAGPEVQLDEGVIEYEFLLHSPPTQYEDPISGIYLITKSAMREIGGFDERFEGWGYEDRAFQVKADRVIGHHGRNQDGAVFHLWHEALAENTWQQPAISKNRDLFHEVLREADG